MNITLGTLTALLAGLGAVQAAGYNRKAARVVSNLQRAGTQQRELTNGRELSVAKAPEPAAQPNVRGGLVAGAQGKKLARKSKVPAKKSEAKKTGTKTRKTPKKPDTKTKTSNKVVEKKQDQFLPPGLQRPNNPANDLPGWAWQQPTVTVTVTRGFERVIVTTTQTVTETATSTNTVSHSSTDWETILGPVESFTTETSTGYTTVTETVAVGSVTVVEETETATEQATVTATETVGPVVTYAADTTVTETAWHTELDYSVVATSTSTIPFSTSTVIHPETTVTEFVEGGPVVVTETAFSSTNAVTTVYGVSTVTETEVAYETPAFY